MKTQIITMTILGLLAASTTIETGCHREIEGLCVEIDPSRDFTGSPSRREICGWELGLPPGPAAGYAKAHRVSVAFPVTDDAPCDPCDMERFEDLLRAEVETKCGGLDYEDLEVGCFIPPDEDSDLCWVIGSYSSSYDHVPIEHGCQPLAEGDAVE